MAHPKGKYLQFAIIVFVLTSLLGACGSTEHSPSAQAPSGSDLAALTPSPAASSTITPIPSLTPTPTFTRAPTRTPLPTYIHITPVLQGTRLPQSGPAISLDNATRLTLLARWGLGNPGDIEYTPDGEYLIVATTTGVYFFNPVDYSLLKQIETRVAISYLAVSPDSQLIAVAAFDQVLIYRITDSMLLNLIQIQANSLDFSPDGEMLAIGTIIGHTDTIQIRSISTGMILLSLESELGVGPIEFSPGGNFIASGGNSTKVWTLDGTLTTDQGPYNSGGETFSVSFSPDGSLLAEGSDNGLHIWRVLENGRLIHHREIDLSRFGYANVHVVAISPDGTMVAGALFKGIYVWSLVTGSSVFKSETYFTHFNSLAWSSDSSYISAGSVKSGVQVWDVRTGEEFATLHSQSGSFSSLAWAPNGQLLAAGAEEGWAYIFNTQNGNLLQRVGRGNSIDSLAFAPNSQVLAVGYQGLHVQFWTIDGALTHTLDGFGYGPSEATYSTDGDLFAANLPADWQTEEVRLWSTYDWSVIRTFPLGASHDFAVGGLRLSPDQRTAAIVYADRRDRYTRYFIQIVSVSDGELISTLDLNSPPNLGGFQAAAYSPSGDLYAVYLTNYSSQTDHQHNHIRVWRTSDWEMLYTLSIDAEDIRLGWPPNRRNTFAWSPDNTLFAVGMSDGRIQILSADNGENLVTLTGHTMWVPGVAFSPDGRILASCSLDGTIMLWGMR